MKCCDVCLHGRAIVSENGVHHICTLPPKQATKCLLGLKDRLVRIREPKGGLIDGNKLVKDLKAMQTQFDAIDLGGLIRGIEEQPTIEAEPVRHGRWEWHENWGNTTRFEMPEMFDAGWRCSVCGIDLVQYLKSHFSDIPSYLECATEEMPTLGRCPNCGAKMDGGAENDSE